MMQFGDQKAAIGRNAGIGNLGANILGFGDILDAQGNPLPFTGQNLAQYGNNALNSMENTRRQGFNTLVDATRQAGQGSEADYAAMASDLMGQANRRLGDYDAAAGDIRSGLENRLKTAMGYLEGQGNYERGAINRQYAQENARLGQNLVDQGLSGTTIGSSLRGGNERRRTESLGGLNERLNRQYLDTYGSMSGDIFNFANQANMARTGLSGEMLGMRQGLLGNEFNLRQNNRGNMLGLQDRGVQENLADQSRRFQFGTGNLANLFELTQSINAGYPSSNLGLQQMLGAGSYPTLKGPSWYDNIFPMMLGSGVGAGVGAGVGGGIASLIGGAGAAGGAGYAAAAFPMLMGSDRDSKTEIEAVNENEILGSVVNLPVYEWSYKGDGARHVGPMAQDFKRAFGVGDTDKAIAVVDAVGVLMASVKALAKEVSELKAQLAVT